MAQNCCFSDCQKNNSVALLSNIYGLILFELMLIDTIEFYILILVYVTLILI